MLYDIGVQPGQAHRRPAPPRRGRPRAGRREFAKGGLVKGGIAIYVFPLCNCNTKHA